MLYLRKYDDPPARANQPGCLIDIMPEPREDLPPPAEKESAAFRSSLELLYEIGREVTADLDLRTLLHRVLFLSMKNVGAISGSIIVLDEDGQPGESALLIMGETRKHTAMQLRVTYEQGMAGWVARHRKSVLIPDTTKDERWLPRPEDLNSVSAAKSAVSAPILARDQLVGVITLVHPQPGFFQPDHVALTEAIADWAGTAILHAQLFERLTAVNRRYRELFEDSIDPILITDGRGTILEVNRQAQKTTSISDVELRDVNIADLEVVDTDRLGAEFSSLSNGETVSYEARLHNRQGVDMPVQVYARAINTGPEERVNIQWILRDLTERRELDRLREDLTAMIYHDLRSPLSNIVSSLDMLSMLLSKVPDDNVQTMLDIARRSTDRIQRLTASLLDVHRLELGQAIGRRIAVQIGEVTADAVAVIQPAAAARSQAICSSVDQDLPPVMGDPDMIRRVLINLLDNAIRFTPDMGSIQIKVGLHDDEVVTSVSDSGPGIPAVYQDRIFEKFNRFGAKDTHRGLGLGLAFCRLAVTAHGGRIWLESEPECGATFKFTLPVGKDDEIN